MKIHLPVLIAIRIIGFLAVFFNCFLGYAQTKTCIPIEGTGKCREFKPLSDYDLVKLKQLPVLEYNPIQLKTTLPSSIDNSQLPYFRPIWTQSDYCCGQASGILYAFTYEIDRLRNLAANVTTNQYPTHFAWDFQNGLEGGTGEGKGVSYLDSWEILKAAGTPNVQEYGGTPDFGGGSRWISGYNTYYSAMHNRVSGIYQINIRTKESIDVLRNWLYDHMDGSTTGGVACMYVQYTSAYETLTTGTPEAGKYVLTQWGGSPNHGLVIVGYNDSIRWDYNSDGQFTKNIDLNGDGILDVRDWEIGGIKVANDFGTGWGNSGFCYVMYKSIAEQPSTGGIWNNTVHVIKVKENCNPLLTMKISIRHTSRFKIKVMAGVSQSLTDTIPAHQLELPIFRFQGGPHYMKGGTAVGDQTIEFGLDVTPLLNYINSGQPAKFFLQVCENDTSGTDNGEIISFSLMNYTTGGTEIFCSSSNVTILNNSTTTLSIQHNITFPQININTSSLPPATLYQPYSQQLTAIGGTNPYKWGVIFDYNESASVATVPNLTTGLITFSNNVAIKDLPFSFPFYGQEYSRIYIHPNGMIKFDNEMIPWPYWDSHRFTTMKHYKSICPFLSNLSVGTGDGVWYQANNDSIIIRWKVSVATLEDYTEVNFAATLFPNGKMKFYYGNITLLPYNWTYGTHNFWTSGISNGDGLNYQGTAFAEFPINPSGNKVILTPLSLQYPKEMSLSEEGLFSGTPTNLYNNCNIKFVAEDQNGLKSSKILPFSTIGMVIDYTIISGGDTMIEYGETANITLSLVNKTGAIINSGNINLLEFSPFITLSDSLQTFGIINIGDTITIPNAFTFIVSSNIPNHTSLPFTFNLTSGTLTQQRNINPYAYAPVLSVTEILIDDNVNNRLDAGDTAQIRVLIKNSGGSKATNLNCILNSADPYLSLINSTYQIDTLKPALSDTAIFSLATSINTPIEHIANSQIFANASNGFHETIDFNLMIGFNAEDFESGDFSMFNWTMSGNANWFNVSPGFEGNDAARSGIITDTMESVLSINMETLEDGYISFYRKISSETNYDFLTFYIDGIVKSKWSGIKEWEQFSFFVQSGQHTFSWVYSKDISVSTGSDCAWVDFIIFPPIGINLAPVLSVTPTSLYQRMPPNSIDSDTLYLTNSGGGKLTYQIGLFNAAGPAKSIAGSSLVTDHSSFYSGDTLTLKFTVHNTSTDSEWLKDISINFPIGVTVNSSTNFIGGTGGPMTQTIIGQQILWHGQDGSGWGVIKGGESAIAYVHITIDTTFIGNIVLPFHLAGDIYGAVPHTIDDSLSLVNLGTLLNWISITPLNDTAFGGNTNIAEVIYNTNGLQLGTYTCNIRILGSQNPIMNIPVTLKVTNLGIAPETIEKTLAPNSMDTDTLTFTNYGTLMLFYTFAISDTVQNQDTSWINVTPATDVINGLSNKSVHVAFNTSGLSIGNYYCFINVTDNLLMESIIPVILHVTNTINLENNQLSEFTHYLWPNPFNSESVLYFSNPNNFEYSIVLSDVAGRIVKKYNNLKGEYTTIERSNLQAGTYYYSIYISNRPAIMGKMIIY
jgi:hypothetical protein